MIHQRSHRRETNHYDRPHFEWKCGKIARGDACGSGPTARGKCLRNACQPLRTACSIRKLLRYATGLAGAFVLLACLISDLRQQTFAPGPLTQAHAQILQGTAPGERCATCHPAGSLTSISWFASWHPSTEDGKTQSQLCLECHERSMPQLAHGTPHNVDRTVLAALKKQPQGQASTDAGFEVAISAPPSPENEPLACAVCHREHHGSKADLQFMANDRCQSCHQSQFASFQHGHPEFDDFPYRTESRIQFSHRSHQDKHFASKNATFDCRSCHFAAGNSATGNVVRSVSFEEACASCHQQSLKAHLIDGLVVLQLPSFDEEVLVKHGLQLGAWPTSNLYAFEGKIPPMMRWLLYSDPSLRAILDRFPDDRDLGDLEWQRRDVCEDLVVLANGIRSLIAEIANEGQPALLRRLEATSKVPPGPKQETVSGIPPDVFRRAYELWFQPYVASNVSGSRQIPLAEPRFAPPEIPDQANEDDLLLNVGDDLDLLTELPHPRDDSDSASKHDDARKPLRSTAVSQGGWLIDEQRTSIVYVGSGHGDRLLTQWLTIATVNRSAIGNGTQEPTKLAFQLETRPQPSELVSTKIVPSEDFGWHRLLHPSLHGGCAECHQLEVSDYQQANEPNFSLWQARPSRSHWRTFTKFDHRPHLLLGSLTHCIACHQLKSVSTSALHVSENSTERVPSKEIQHVHLGSQGEFEPMRKADCVSCHREGAANDQCTTCHNYHVGELHRSRESLIRFALEPTSADVRGQAAIR